jgi:hypothetical protein
MAGKHRAKKTLTKIDPRALKPKPPALSLHATHKGKRVTTVVKPVRQPPVPPVNPLGFDLDLENFNEKHLEDDVAEEDVSRAYYVTRVSDSHFFNVRRVIVTRTIRFC